MKKILLLLVLALSFSGCEKDDICTEDTTPRLVLEFYDISSPATLKNVTNLKAVGEGETNGVVFNEDGTAITKYLTNDNKVMLPLDPSQTTTEYHLYLNSTDADNINEDVLTFNYATQTVYVSRACGYKITYTLNDTDGAVYADSDPADTFWIKNLNIQTKTITTENEVHIKVYF